MSLRKKKYLCFSVLLLLLLIIDFSNRVNDRIGENAKAGDLEVNPVRAKAATNIRTQNKDEKVYLQPPKRMSVEELLGYMGNDEMLEVTPTNIRLRKAELDPVERRKASRIKKQQQDSLRRAK